MRDAAAREDAVRGVIEAIEADGGTVPARPTRGLPGPKGNREVFVHAVAAAGAG